MSAAGGKKVHLTFTFLFLKKKKEIPLEIVLQFVLQTFFE